MEKLNKEELEVLLEYFKNESEENRQKHRQYLEKDNLQENHESRFHFFRNQTGETKTRLMQVFNDRLKHEMSLKKDILKDVKELVKNEKKNSFLSQVSWLFRFSFSFLKINANNNEIIFFNFLFIFIYFI